MMSEARLKAIEERLNIARKLGDDEDGPNWYARDVGWLVEENHRLREALAAIRDYAAPRSDLSVYVEIMYEMASDAIRGEQP